LGVSNFGAKVGFFVLTENAFLLVALRSVAGDDDIANLDSGDSFTNTFDDSCGFVAENAWELTFRIASVQSVNVGMTQGVRDDFDSDLSLFRRINKDFFNNERLFSFVSNGCFTENWLSFETFHSKRYD